jgi:hypothetical protein
MRTLLLTLCLAVATPALSTGCTDEMQAQFDANEKKRKREMQRKVLTERAMDYWNAVRWQNWDEASVFLEESENQLLYLRDKTRDDVKFPTMDDVQIDYIFVDGETFKKAEVRASWTEFKPPNRMAEEKQTSQSWYKNHAFWWVAPEAVLPELVLKEIEAANTPPADSTADSTTETAPPKASP